jgi:hypothetical protein
MSQMVVMSFMPETTQATRGASNTFSVPPFQQLAIPLQPNFPQGEFNAGRAQRGGRGRVGDTGVMDVLRLRITCARQVRAQHCLARLFSCVEAACKSPLFWGDSISPGILSSQTFTNGLIIGMFASHADSTLRTDTRPPCAHLKRQITKHRMCTRMPSNSSQQSMTHAPEGCKKWYSHLDGSPNGVGQRVKL